MRDDAWKDSYDAWKLQSPYDDDYDDYYDDGECWQCAGEGYVYDCIDGLCVNAEDGCDLCKRRCYVCNPLRPKPGLEPSTVEDDEIKF